MAENKRKNTKQRIIEESMKLFSIHGFDAVSIRTIADAVNVGNSALYKHFKSKKEILDSIIEYSKEYFYEMSSKQMKGIQTLEQMQEACLNMFVFQTQDEWMVMFRRLLIIEQFKNPDMAKIYQNFFIEMPIQTQKTLFDELIKGGILKDRNSYVMAMELYAPFFLYHTAADSRPDLMELLSKHIQNFYEENIIHEKTISE